tara:strand:+ start:75 stop:281 length:207 start_codon:yes stop_codon:yes gene_type:complete
MCAFLVVQQLIARMIFVKFAILIVNGYSKAAVDSIQMAGDLIVEAVWILNCAVGNLMIWSIPRNEKCD